MTKRKELQDDFYDNAYQAAPMYKQPYKEVPYYNHIWKFVLTLINRKTDVVADFGCGPGQFPNFLYDMGVNFAYGVDFSAEAVRMSKELIPVWKFFKGNLYDPDTYKKAEYNTAICLETLEHIEKDYLFFQNLPKGTKVIISVPDFDSVSHVRFFKSCKAAKNRFKKWMKISGGKEFELGPKKIFVIWGEV